MNPQEWSFEAQLTLRGARSPSLASPGVFQQPVTKGLQQNGRGGLFACTQRPQLSPPPQACYSRDGLRSTGVRMEYSWHPLPGVQSRSSEAPIKLNDNFSPFRNVQGGCATQARPKSYHATGAATSQQHLGRPRSSDDMCTAPPHAIYRPFEHGYRITVSSQTYPTLAEHRVLQEPVYKVQPQQPNRFVSPKSQPPSSPSRGGNVQWQLRPEVSPPSFRASPMPVNVQDKVCKSTCNIVLENNVSPLSKYDEWVKSHLKDDRASEQGLDLLAFEKHALQRKVRLAQEDICVPVQAGCSDPAFRPRSQSDTNQTFSTQFCTHVASRRAQSYAASGPHKTDPCLALSPSKDALPTPSTTSRSGQTESTKKTKSHSYSHVKRKPTREDQVTRNKHRECKSVSPQRTNSKPRTIHIDVYCSDEEGDSDDETLCNSSDEGWINSEPNISKAVLQKAKRLSASESNLSGDDAAVLCDSFEYVKTCDYLRTQNQSHGTTLQVSNKSKLIRRSPSFRGIKDACESLSRGDSGRIAQLPTGPSTSSLPPIEQIRRRLAPVKYWDKKHRSTELPLSCVEKAINDFRQPFTQPGGLKSEHFDKAGTFGHVLPVVRKPGHHVGPIRNQHCLCEHCQRYFATSASAARGGKRAQGKEIVPTAGDHVGKSTIYKKHPACCVD